MSTLSSDQFRRTVWLCSDLEAIYSHFQQLNPRITLTLFYVFSNTAVCCSPEEAFPLSVWTLLSSDSLQKVNCWWCEEKLKTHCLPLMFCSQPWPKNRLYPLTGTMTSFSILILSIPQLDFQSRVQRPVPLPQLSTYSFRPHSRTVSQTQAKGHRGWVMTPWHVGNPGEPPQRLLLIPSSGHLEHSQLRSQNR